MRAIEEYFCINNNIHVLLSHQHINHKYPEAVGRGYDTRPSLWGMTGGGDGPILLMGPSATTLLQGTCHLFSAFISLTTLRWWLRIKLLGQFQ